MIMSLFCNPTRGIRNNNPANIRHSSSRWIGLSSVQADNEFCQFDDLKFGIRAFLILCRTYYKKYGIRTIPQFLNRFAPLSENDTLAYIKFCLKHCGFEVFHDDEDFAAFACAVFWYESRLSCTSAYVLYWMKEFRIKIC